MTQRKSNKTRLRILFGGDSVQDVRLIRDSLKDSGFIVRLDYAEKKRKYVSLLRAKNYDVILVDFTLPAFDSLAALRVASRERPGIPFIGVSSSMSKETAIRFIKRGAVDYVTKDRLNRLPHAITRALAERREKETLKAAEEALRESERRFYLLAENSPVGIFQTDAEGKTIYVNPRWCRISGLSREKAMGMGWLKAVHPDDRMQLKTNWERATRVHKPSEAEYRFVHPNGTSSWVIGRAIPERNSGKKVTGYIGTITDITARKRVEETLEESEARYRFLFEHNPMPMLIYELKHFAILAVNDAFTEHYGYSRKEATTLRIIDLHPPDEKKWVLNHIKKLATRPYAGEWHHVKKDGTIISIEIHSDGIPYDGHTARIAVINDITDRRRVEEALKDKERRLAHAQTVGHVGFLDWDLRSNKIFLSEEACRIHGIDPKEELLTPELVAKVVHPDDMEFVRAELEQAVRGSKTYDIDHRIHWPDGTVRWVHAQAQLLRDPDGNPERLLGTVIDITERKQAEQALNESEEQYRKLVELLPDALFVNINAQIVLANRACCTLLGASDPSELLGKSIFEIVHPDYHSKVRQRRRVTLAGGAAPLVEEKFVRLDGSVVDVNVTSVGIEWRGSRGTQVIVRDVTEHKKADEELRESQERYRSLFENNLVGVFQTAPDGRVLDCNDAFARLFGLRSKADLNGRLAQEFYPTPGDRERYLRLLQEQGQLRNFEFVRKRDDGSLFWTVENVRVVRSPEGQPLRLEGTIIDISEKKEAERELQESQERYRRLFEDHMAVKLVIDAETWAIIDANEAAVRFYGWPREQLKGMTIGDLNILPPESLKTEIEGIVSKTGGHSQFQHRLADGTTRDVEVFTSVIEIHGKTVFESIVHDITERKRAEAAVRESEERYRRLITFLSDPVYIHVDGHVTFANQAMCRLLGASDASQLLGKSVFEILHPDYHEMVRRRLILVFGGELAPAIEEKFLRLDGSAVDVEVSAVSIDWQGSIGVQVVARDITERRRNEREIRKLNRIFNVLSNINQAIVRIHDESLLYNEVCRIAVKDGGFVMAWLGTVDYSNQKIEVAALSGVAEDYLRKINIDLKDKKRSEGPTGRAFATGNYVVSNEIDTDEIMTPWREEAIRIGYRSSAAFPIKVFGKVWGVFNLYSDEPGFFNTDEIRLLEELAMDISFALEFIHGELEQKRAEESLKKSEELLQSSVRIANIGIFEHDQVNDTIFWSPKLREIYGVGPDEKVTLNTSLDLVHSADVERVSASVRSAHDPSGDGLWDVEFRIVRRDGTVRWVDGRSQTFFQGQGEARHSVRTVGLILDITDRKEAEERLRVSDEILRRVNSLILIADASGRITYASPSVKTILGYDTEEVMGEGWWILTHQDKPDRKQSIAAAARGEIPVAEAAYETRVQAKDGKFHWLLWQDARGMNQELIGVGQDISDRKQTEEALVLSERKYKDIFDSAPMGIYQSTVDGKFITCNSELSRILGYDSPDEMIGIDLASEVYRDDEERVNLVGQSEPPDSAADLEVCWKKKDGSPVWIQLNKRTVKDATGKTLHFEGFVRDITERKLAEERLKQNETRQRELELELMQAQKLEGLGTLASGIAHDFNNLLGVIIGHATLLERSFTDAQDRYRKNVDAILKASTRGAGLVKQMLTFARKNDVMMESVLLNDLIGETVKFIGETFSKTIIIETHLAPNLPSIDADVTQVHQVLLNLCVNARDAMPNGGTLTISTGTEDREEILSRHPKAIARAYVVLTVIDTGTGMDEDTQQRIFEPFFTTKDHGKGSGLGLSLVFGIMDSHDGFITVRSDPGKGTTFHCYFPLPQGVREAPAVEESGVETIPGGSETILVVEDEEMLRELLAEILAPKGYAVLLAEDGEQGIALYREHSDTVALVLSDLGLPKFGGDELYRRLKEIDPDVRLILSSGYMEPGVKGELLGEGIKEIVPKPYSPTDVLRSVRRVIDGA